ncbi:hypothetical protein CTA1_11872 [Colletotrichum tanaceti]|uniref:PD-(D/E)XK nuclease-like domain-containing protein n=1 Tax=Colletotrichum tanaceti TaxID=1306861 RepID=A0A4U6XI68_9PEZI|nr:hypothetical protein CTA1_11872 [Colletotrichum tanaceti]
MTPTKRQKLLHNDLEATPTNLTSLSQLNLDSASISTFDTTSDSGVSGASCRSASPKKRERELRQAGECPLHGDLISNRPEPTPLMTDLYNLLPCLARLPSRQPTMPSCSSPPESGLASAVRTFRKPDPHTQHATHLQLPDNPDTPTVIPIETKSATADMVSGPVQLAAWAQLHFAYLERLPSAGGQLPVLPVILVHGARWRVDFAQRTTDKLVSLVSVQSFPVEISTNNSYNS